MSGNDSPLNGSSSQPEWYVMIDGERQGPYGLHALQQLISLGQIDGDSSVTRAGTTETMSFEMVDELRPLLDDAPLQNSAPPPIGEVPNFDAPTEMTDGAAFGSLDEPAVPRESINTVDLDAALLEVASMAPPPPDDPPPVPASARTNGARKESPLLFSPQPDDLAPTEFETTPRGALKNAVRKNSGGRESGVSGTIPLSERPTGARNENSLLFKIVESGGRVTAAPQKPGAQKIEEIDLSPERNADSSGLLDISALANASGGSAKVRPRKSKLDDILTVGNTGLGAPPGPTLLSPTLAPVPSRPPPAPVSIAPPPAVNKTVVYTAAIVSLIVTFGVAATQIMLHRLDANQPQPTQVIVNPMPVDPRPTIPETQPPTPGPTLAPPTPPAPTLAPPTNLVAPPTTPVAPIARPTQPPAPVAAPPVAPPIATAPPVAPHVHVHVPTPPGERPARPAPVAARPVAPTPTPPSTPTVDPNLPAQPSRDTVASAMSDVAVVVRACGIQSATQVTITFVGSGRVTTASVGAPYGGTEIGSCVARAVRGARLPAFREAPLNVVYSFRP